jgi:ubiquitin C-terminal hydrolase
MYARGSGSGSGSGSADAWKNYDDSAVRTVPDTEVISADSYILFLHPKP